MELSEFRKNVAIVKAVCKDESIPNTIVALKNKVAELEEEIKTLKGE